MQSCRLPTVPPMNHLRHTSKAIARACRVNPARFHRLAATLLLVFPLWLGAGCATAAAPTPTPPQATGVGQDKALLTKLIAELQRSSRSFIYLRSQGFKLSDSEFEQLIASNNKVLRSTRIIRHDERGMRQIPGWPAVALTPEYKASTSVAPSKGK